MTSELRSAALILLVTAAPAAAQLTAAGDAPVAYGHHHLVVTSIEAHKHFWIDALGGTSVKIGTSPTDVIMFPNVLVLLRAGTPTGGTKGTIVNHVGFEVPDIRAAVNKVRAAGFPIVTKAEVPTWSEEDGVATNPAQGSVIAFAMGPDDVKVELYENKAATRPIALHHIHFNTPQVPEMQAWYAKVFGARPGKRGASDAADLPGVNLTFSPAAGAVVPTRGRSLDHIGFEVKNLEEMCKRLQEMGIALDRPYTKVPAMGIAIAFITDPWGTYIELTEGLAAVR